MRKKRPFLLFWLVGFFIILILSAVISGKLTADLAHEEPEKTIANKASVDEFKKEFSTYWWADYEVVANYEKGELEIYLPKDKEKNQFINVNDVLSAISIRQVQHGDKHLTVLLLTDDKQKVARLKNGKVSSSYSEKVDPEMVDQRLAEWQKTTEEIQEISETTSDSVSDETTSTTSSVTVTEP
ncbi:MULTISPECIES: hypothetical protein [Enterococcus]|nr:MULTISPECIES: hypothetical protein [unclassified Enterococcus]MBO0462795.1 hypothetical protein [Enterococcus sp. DIV1298c]MBO0491380.1 hypothetical protein [Enterococcus sp. DIV1094]MBO1301113.1 hypothetical protein [Enterococcus sp. DIV1271a]